MAKSERSTKAVASTASKILNVPKNGGLNGGPTQLSRQLEHFWSRPVSDLATVENKTVSPGEKERHHIYCNLVLALVAGFWNGNKRGALGTYPQRLKQRVSRGRYRGDASGDRYLGHNIACIAVDQYGEILDFDFNHNEIFNSSAEHAEARLIRRIFSLNQIYSRKYRVEQSHDVGYGKVFNGITVYTSLESCSQCSGIMTLANCERVVFLQTDPGQSRVGHMLYNLTQPVPTQTRQFMQIKSARPNPPAKYGAPEPVDAHEVYEFAAKKDLDDAFGSFAKRMGMTKGYFHKDANGVFDKSASVTSFLCTDDALDVFMSGSAVLKNTTLHHKDFRATTGALSNGEVLKQAQDFLAMALKESRRGTPHR
jgi:tRNA(Arg) A34 adenosine deaminase TadA